MTPCLQIMLDYGADIDHTDKYGETPLIWAASRGRSSVIETLMERGKEQLDLRGS